MTQSSFITWDKILLICSSIVIPILGLGITVVIFGTRIDDRLTTLTSRQDKQDIFNNDFKTQLDTVKERQERYYYETNGKFQRLEDRRK